MTRDGVPLDLGPPKQRAALAALLLAEGRVVSTDRLIEAVWGDDPPARAVASIQVYVSRLRGLLQSQDSSGLTRRAPGYRLSGGWVDVTEFRRLTAQAADLVAAKAWAAAADAAGTAVALWRGPFLDDLADEPWVRAEAIHLDEMYAQCMESSVTALLGSGNIGEAVTRSQTMVEAYPLREHCWWLRMIALHRAGRAPEALDAFQTFTGELDEQLGLEPGAALRELQTAILRHDPAMASWPDEARRGGPTSPDGGRVPQRPARGDEPATTPVTPTAQRTSTQGSTTIVGRVDELAALDRAIEDVLAGECRWVVVTGRAGMGKTRLATEASARAGQRGAKACGRVVLMTSARRPGGRCGPWCPSWAPIRTRCSSRATAWMPTPSGSSSTTASRACSRPRRRDIRCSW